MSEARHIALSALEPVLLKINDPKNWQIVDSIAEADGVQFVCPKCMLDANLVRPGVHSVVCWKIGVSPEVLPGPGRWNLEGTDLEDLSLVAGSSSVKLLGEGCGAHFFVRKGQVEVLDE